MKLFNKEFCKCVLFNALLFCLSIHILCAEDAPNNFTNVKENSEDSLEASILKSFQLNDNPGSSVNDTNEANNLEKSQVADINIVEDKNTKKIETSTLPLPQGQTSEDSASTSDTTDVKITVNASFDNEDYIDNSTAEKKLELFKDPDYLDYLYYNQKQIGNINDVRVIDNGNNSFKLVFNLDRQFLANVRIVNFPFRLIIDIPMPYQWAVSSEVIKKNIPIDFIQSFRYGRISKNSFRMIADLSHPVRVENSVVENNPDGTYNFIITLSKNVSGDQVWESNNLSYVKSKEIIGQISQISDMKSKNEVFQKYSTVVEPFVKQYLSKVTYPKPKSPFPERKVTVVLDPGHGGKDPGSISKDNLLIEKELVLKIAKQIREELLKNKDINVILTREDDYYLPLKDRVLWAQFYKADLFVSIHADNSETGEETSGMSIYTLSDKASDAQAQLIANQVNSSDIVAGITNNTDEDVAKILVRLSQRMKVNDSLLLARNIVSKSVGNIRIMENPLRSAGFAVLKTPNIPSVLVEVGFLSNPDDVSLFRTNIYLKRVSTSISIGIQQYLWETDAFQLIPSAILQQQNYDKIQSHNKQIIEQEQMLIRKAVQQVQIDKEGQAGVSSDKFINRENDNILKAEKSTSQKAIEIPEVSDIKKGTVPPNMPKKAETEGKNSDLPLVEPNTTESNEIEDNFY